MAEVTSCQVQAHAFRGFPFPSPRTHRKPCQGSPTALRQLCWRSQLAVPAKFSLPAIPAEIQTCEWRLQTTSGYHLQQRIAWLGSPRIPWPTKSWDIFKNGCFKPLHFRIIMCYTIITRSESWRRLHRVYSAPQTSTRVLIDVIHLARAGWHISEKTWADWFQLLIWLNKCCFSSSGLLGSVEQRSRPTSGHRDYK